MADVYTEYYRLSGESLLEADAFHKEREAAVETTIAHIKSIGGVAAKTRGSRVHSVQFPSGSVPEGWLVLQYNGDMVHCRPHMVKKLGKAASAALGELPKVHEYTELLCRIAPDVGKVMQVKNGNMLMRPTCQRLSMPDVTYLATIPRAIGDGLEVPGDWLELKEAEFTLAFHEHNAQAARNRAAAEEDGNGE